MFVYLSKRTKSIFRSSDDKGQRCLEFISEQMSSRNDLTPKLKRECKALVDKLESFECPI